MKETCDGSKKMHLCIPPFPRSSVSTSCRKNKLTFFYFTEISCTLFYLAYDVNTLLAMLPDDMAWEQAEEISENW